MGLFDAFKKVGGVIKGAKDVIDIVKQGIKVAEALDDDVDGDGKIEIDNLKEDCLVLERLTVDYFKAAQKQGGIVIKRLKSIFAHVEAARLASAQQGSDVA